MTQSQSNTRGGSGKRRSRSSAGAQRKPVPQKPSDLDRKLDDALEDTFPASDPIELSQYRD